MYCEKPKTEDEHFACDVCGEGMCDDCYDSDTPHDEHYFEPLENCDDEREVNLITRASGGKEPAYVCTNCLNAINGEPLKKVNDETYLEADEADKFRSIFGRVKQGQAVYASWVIDTVLGTLSKEEIDKRLLLNGYDVQWSKLRGVRK